MVNNRARKITILCVLLMGVLIFAGYAHGEEKQITIAILPCKDVVMTFKRFHPLLTYLKQQSGLEATLVVPNDSTEFEKSLRNGDIDFAFQDPYTYVRLADLYHRGSLLRALNRKGETLQSGVVITRKDSGANKIEDLKGKTVMFGPKLSATNWVLAKLLFEEKGINIDKDLKAYSNGICCEDIAFNVYLRTVDAGVVCDHFIEEHADKQQELGIDAKEIIVIGRTRVIPTNVFSANRLVSEEITLIINAALLSLDQGKEEHKKLLDPAELSGFEKARDEEFNDMRVLVDKEIKPQKTLDE